MLVQTSTRRVTFSRTHMMYATGGSCEACDVSRRRLQVEARSGLHESRARILSRAQQLAKMRERRRVGRAGADDVLRAATSSTRALRNSRVRTTLRS